MFTDTVKLVFKLVGWPRGWRTSLFSASCMLCVLSFAPVLAVQAASQVLYVNASAPAGGNGSSWGTAFQSVQTAVTAASSGSQVWVAAGTYTEPAVSYTNILMKDGVSLYGGFAGTETSLSQRNWTTHLTILQGTSGDTLIKIPGLVAMPMVISGFEMTGTVAINIAGSTTPVTISDNIFQALADIENVGGNPLVQFNTFQLNQRGAQAVALTGAPQILDNILVVPNGALNTSGIAVLNNSSSLQAVVASNLLVGVGTAISAESASPLIANNTVVGATVAGISITSGSSPTIVNNIIAFNPGIGIHNQVVQSLVEEYNLVYGNGTNYSGLSAGSHDIQENPLFVNQTSNFELTASSPAINAGDDNVVQAGWVDLNGNPRILGANVDLGAYEVVPSGTILATPVISPSGGLFGEPPTVTITSASQAATIYYTLDGTTPSTSSTAYTAPITVPLPATSSTTTMLKAVALTSSGQSGMAIAQFGRVPVVYVNASAPAGGNGSSWGTAFQSVQTAVTAASSGSQVWVAAGTYTEPSVSYTNILMKDGVSLYGGFAGTETSLSQRNWTAHLTILQGTSGDTLIKIPGLVAMPMVISGFEMTGTVAINIAGSTTPVTISNNIFQALAGIENVGGNPLIQFNTFQLNQRGAQAVALTGAPQILDNILVVQNGALNTSGIAVLNNSSSLQGVVANDLLVGVGTAISAESASPLIENNTVVGSTVAGISITSGSSPTIVNNIIAFNPGIGIDNQVVQSLVEEYNLVYGNGTNYSGLSAGSHDIQENPLFVNQTSNFQLTASSPALTTADGSVVQSGWVDLDGNPMTPGADPAMGAYQVAASSSKEAVPNVVGDTQAAATTAITGAGLVAGTVTKQSSSTVASGSVISESPVAGTSVSAGSAVNLVVSSGPASIAVPNVVGDTQAAATTAITGAGLVAGTVTKQSSSTVASGSVISESPVAGTSVSAGSAVNLVVSSGPASIAVPNVVGDTQAAATTAITGAGLVAGTVTKQSSSTVASGSVISESPVAGTSVSAGSAVNLVVSSGPASIAVPNVVGDTQAAATTAITGAGLVAGTVTKQSSSTVASGSVISESPVAGTSVSAGSAVNLVVSSGPATISVPNVVGDTQAAATTAITGAGLVAGTVTKQSSSTVASGSVISESPVAGTSVSAGSAVNLVVSSGPAPISVPNVVGDTQAAATTAITGAGLVAGTVTTQSSSTVASGSVISESPVAGTSVSTGSAVNLVVSSGPAQVSVPSVEPASGSGLEQTLTFRFTDQAGISDINVVDVLINSELDGQNACFLAYVPSANTLYLVDNGGDAGGPYAGSMVLNGGGGSIQNSQCQINSTGSVATSTGTTLALTLNVTFESAFAGNQIVHLAQVNTSGYTAGWQCVGVWQVPGSPAAQITISSQSPSRGLSTAGIDQPFTFVITDTSGYADLGVVNVLINNFINGIDACYLAYAESSNTLYLVDNEGDVGGPYAGSMVLNGTGSIQNSQCQIEGAGSSAVGSGDTLTLTLNILFYEGFAGNQSVYSAARDSGGNNNTGWQALGTWSVQ